MVLEGVETRIILRVPVYDFGHWATNTMLMSQALPLHSEPNRVLNGAVFMLYNVHSEPNMGVIVYRFQHD